MQNLKMRIWAEFQLPVNREINIGVLSLPRGRSTKGKENEKDEEKHGK
jgi:hypothetical protein